MNTLPMRCLTDMHAQLDEIFLVPICLILHTFSSLQRAFWSELFVEKRGEANCMDHKHYMQQRYYRQNLCKRRTKKGIIGWRTDLSFEASKALRSSRMRST